MAGERLGVLIEDADGDCRPKGRLQRVDKLVAIGIGETGKKADVNSFPSKFSLIPGNLNTSIAALSFVSQPAGSASGSTVISPFTLAAPNAVLNESRIDVLVASSLTVPARVTTPFSLTSDNLLGSRPFGFRIRQNAW